MTEKLVIDSSVAVKWFASEADSAQALLIYKKYEQGSLEFIAPDLIYTEYGNIIWKKHIFQDMTQAEVNYAVEEFKNVSFTLTPTTSLFDDAFKIAVKYKRTFYDSLYLALSVRENCEFVTADEKFYNSVKRDFPQIILLADWH